MYYFFVYKYYIQVGEEEGDYIMSDEEEDTDDEQCNSVILIWKKFVNLNKTSYKPFQTCSVAILKLQKSINYEINK